MEKKVDLPGASKVATEFKKFLSKTAEKEVVLFEGYRNEALALLADEPQTTYFKIRIERI